MLIRIGDVFEDVEADHIVKPGMRKGFGDLDAPMLFDIVAMMRALLGARNGTAARFCGSDQMARADADFQDASLAQHRSDLVEPREIRCDANRAFNPADEIVVVIEVSVDRAAIGPKVGVATR